MEEKDTNRWGTVLFNGTATLGFGKDLKAQNRLRALEFTAKYMNVPIELCEKISKLDYCKQEAEKILDWAYEEEEKEVNPVEWSSCEYLIKILERAFINQEAIRKEVEREESDLIANSVKLYHKKQEKEKEKENNLFLEFGEHAELLNRWIALQEEIDKMIFKWHLNVIKKTYGDNH